MNCIITRLALIIIGFIISCPVVNAQSFITESGYAEFESRAPLLTFKGTSNHLAGLIDLDKKLIDFFLDLNTIDTGIRLRNRHMRDSYLETDKYPYAEFTGTIITPFDPDDPTPQIVAADGKFRIHGVEREIRVEGTLEVDAGGLSLNASWILMLEDYNIDRPRVVFYELADEQVVNIRALLKPREE